MKNAMKKLMSLVLVAMILVSALPFAASAAEGDPFAFWIELKLDGEHVDSQTVSVPEGTEMNDDAVKQYAEGIYGAYFGEGYEYVGCYDQGGKAGVDGYIGAGIEFKTKPAETEPVETEPVETEPVETAPTAYPMSIDVDGEMKVLTDRVSITYEEVLQMTGLKASDIDYIVYEGSAVQGTQFLDAGYTINLAGETRIFVFTEPTTPPATTTPTTPEDDDDDKNVVDEEWMKDIYLYIYTNNDIIAPAKRVLLNNYLVVKDHTLDKSEILSVVDDYYKASNSNNGIIWKGAYMENANIDAINFVNGRDEVPFKDLDVARSGASAVVIKVRVTGVTTTSSSSGTADTTNPKTGDELYKAVTVMAVSASALALGFYFNKKRAIQ